MSIFVPSDAPCGIFAPSLCGDGAYYTLSFARTTALLAWRAPSQTTAGELALSFTPISTVHMEMQPKSLPLARLIHGQVIEVAYTGFAPPTADIRITDRSYFLGKQLEVVNVLPWVDHQEIEFRWVGR